MQKAPIAEPLSIQLGDIATPTGPKRQQIPIPKLSKVVKQVVPFLTQMLAQKNHFQFQMHNSINMHKSVKFLTFSFFGVSWITT